MGDWLAGCDICQDVCPFNQGSGFGDQGSGGGASDGAPNPRYAPRDELAEGLPLLEVLGWTQEDRQRAFQGSALKRVKLDMLKRNALIAAGNALRERDDAAVRRRIKTVAEDEAEPALVRTTAQQVLDGLGA